RQDRLHVRLYTSISDPWGERPQLTRGLGPPTAVGRPRADLILCSSAAAGVVAAARARVARARALHHPAALRAGRAELERARELGGLHRRRVRQRRGGGLRAAVAPGAAVPA